jgi:hypothetical protein
MDIGGITDECAGGRNSNTTAALSDHIISAVDNADDDNDSVNNITGAAPVIVAAAPADYGVNEEDHDHRNQASTTTTSTAAMLSARKVTDGKSAAMYRQAMTGGSHSSHN